MEGQGIERCSFVERCATTKAHLRYAGENETALVPQRCETPDLSLRSTQLHICNRKL
ncbi:hypothetical protein KIN20_031326 [Parelaphostrongylus tenuis]|uniref:Uncharacterized protein n=1 Tax=Parelaphostrongylus tenuis TaxID=148309 RepID=A0AAD5WGQ9_PARTN|nr:hypothetical protein KIN20_031326 [Parelaphostrongylus tenuis]